MNINKLTLYLGKTKAQLIGSYCCVPKNTQINVKYNDQTIDQMYSAKSLGINIDSNLPWLVHIF